METTEQSKETKTPEKQQDMAMDQKEAKRPVNDADLEHAKAENAKLSEENTKLKAENAALQEKVNLILLKYADMDNARKRAIRDCDEGIARAKANMVRDLLPTLDDFQRAVAAAEKSDDYGKMLEGVKMIQTNLFSMLEKNYGLEVMHPEGKPYDHNQQEVFLVVEDEKLKDEVVLETLIPGYTIDGKVLRPAKVKLGKPKAKN
ncbi:MAG: nucleotide exchange factor GrpE [Sphaerochaeta sp.]|jgi:molecular chaperone GrpE|nr:nucleotide exchange factor GrpE [Sphaerochaeta sp.]MCI2077087.1 nucleotide exchange factor GrpE [Sphaerochaeta sp.]